MASQFPVQTWGRMISPNEDEIPAQLFGDAPASVSITMAALDPGEEWSNNAGIEEFKGKKPRATIKMIVYPTEDSDDEDDEDEDDETDPNLAALLDEDDSDEEGNGEGPSDPNKSPKARLAQELLGHEDSKAAVNGISKKNKGKAKAAPGEAESEEDAEDDDEDINSDDVDMDMNDLPEEYVLCTLDPDSHYQQPLNLVISPNENVFFRVEGTHSVHLTGNYLADDGFDDDDDYDSDEYDLPPDEDELADLPSDLEADEDDNELDDEESDELDDTADPRVTELASDDDEAPPALTKASNKRAAAEEEDSDADMAEPDAKPLSKSQAKKMRKKLKDNAGNALEVATATGKTLNGKTVTGATADLKSAKGDKKVQFAKTLVQGPSAAEGNKGGTAGDNKQKASLGTKKVNGVTIDDKKLGSGPAAKNGSRVSMRYIGKLDATKRVFDSNKKGPPFTFKLGAGQVIRGWEIGVQGIQAGGERRITIPANLAYGSKKTGDIPPHSDLVFDVKALEIK